MTGPAAHATLGPSAAKRWMTCPGSVAAIAACPVEDTTSEAAAEGTAAHALAEILLRERIELKGRGDLMREWAAEYGEKYDANGLKAGVMPYVDEVSDAWEALGGRKHARLLLERRVFVIDGVYGTADAVVISDKGVLHVLDLKFGRGVRVEAEDNPQLRSYALGALQDAELERDIHEVRMTIVQPRHKDGGHTSTAVMTAEALHAWGRELAAAAASAGAAMPEQDFGRAAVGATRDFGALWQDLLDGSFALLGGSGCENLGLNPYEGYVPDRDAVAPAASGERSPPSSPTPARGRCPPAPP